MSWLSKMVTSLSKEINGLFHLEFFPARLAVNFSFQTICANQLFAFIICDFKARIILLI